MNCPHEYMRRSVNPPGAYVRILVSRTGGKKATWHWAVKFDKPKMVRGVEHPWYIVVTEEGEVPSEETSENKYKETRHLVIGAAEKEKTAAMCLVHGVLEPVDDDEVGKLAGEVGDLLK